MTGHKAEMRYKFKSTWFIIRAMDLPVACII